MEEKNRCGQCGRDFATAEGLAQHMRDKHGVGAASSHEMKEQRKAERDEQLRKEKEKSGRAKLTRKILIVGGAFLLLSGLIYAFTIFGKPEKILADEDYILKTNLRSHSGVSMHIHPHITVRINGSAVAIPAEIGITDGVMSVIHTHDTSGTLHLESPVPKDFNVGHFFFMWSRTSGEQKTFNSTCILQYCNDGNMTVKMLVNGAANQEYEKFVMHDLDRIEIRYE